MISYKIILR